MPSDTQTPPRFMEWKDLNSLVGPIRTRSLVARPTTIEQCRETLAFCRQNDMTICARGAGRGYGDLARRVGIDPVLNKQWRGKKNLNLMKGK